MAEVSVIIVTRNTCELTCAATRSVLEGSDSLAKEVIVIDNASTDQTTQQLPREFPQVRYLRSEINLGFAKANNLGAQQATGEFLVLLNSDARLQPDTLDQAIGWMRAHPNCGVAGAQLLNPDGSRQNSIANFPTLATELLNKSLLRRLFPGRFPGKERQLGAPLEVESLVGAFLVIRRKTWQQVGGLDERFFFFLEETDFCLQARRAGWKVVHLPQLQVWHEQGRSAGQQPAAVRIEYWRSRYAYFGKNHRLGTRALLRAGLAVKLLAEWLASALLFVFSFGGSPRWRRQWTVNCALMDWHLRGCPEQMGLPR
jgi:GT2 family glycosyltransferase